MHLNQSDKVFSKPAGYTTCHCEVAQGLTMRVFVCLGFLLAANAANAQTTTTTVNRPRRYQPTGSSAYNPMGY